MPVSKENFAPSKIPSGVDPAMMDALRKARAEIPEAGRVLARKIFTDTLVPAVGNRYAYNDFLSRHHSDGVHVKIDNNDFGSVNKKFGDHAGDEILQAYGSMASKLSRLYRGKAFRVGGDEWAHHFDTFKSARKFVSDLTGALDRAPAAYGDHKVSDSVGIGSSRDHAERALMEAKAAKKAAGAPEGQAANHIRSSIEFSDKDE